MRKTTTLLLLTVTVLAFAGIAVYAVLSKDALVRGSGLGDTTTAAKPISLETAQLILPDGHPEFPAGLAWVVVPGDPVPMEVPIPLEIPASWQSKYATRILQDTAYFDYVVDPARPERIFSITALTEAGWQALQNEPHGEAVFSYGGITWVYNPALENPYAGEQADEFSRMVGEAHGVAQSLAGFFTPQVTSETTLPVLQTYFDALAAGNYAEAALLYGGSLDVLAEYNPDIDPQDRGALFERACTANGFTCDLKIGEIVTVEQISPTAIQFTLTLLNPDGSLYELGACCEAESSLTKVKADFEFHVVLQDGLFRVMELPAYAP